MLSLGLGSALIDFISGFLVFLGSTLWLGACTLGLISVCVGSDLQDDFQKSCRCVCWVWAAGMGKNHGIQVSNRLATRASLLYFLCCW